MKKITAMRLRNHCFFSSCVGCFEEGSRGSKVSFISFGSFDRINLTFSLSANLYMIQKWQALLEKYGLKLLLTKMAKQGWVWEILWVSESSMREEMETKERVFLFFFFSSSMMTSKKSRHEIYFIMFFPLLKSKTQNPKWGPFSFDDYLFLDYFPTTPPKTRNFALEKRHNKKLTDRNNQKPQKPEQS